MNAAEGADVPRRDFTGLDCDAWVYDLFRPDEPYSARGVHPSGVGIDRYRAYSRLAPEEQAYLRRQTNLSLLNFLDPNLLGIQRIRWPWTSAGAPVDFNVAVRHLPAAFGHDVRTLLTQAEQVACFRNAACHLGPGGRFVVELWVPELRRLPPGQQAAVWRSEPGYIALQTYDVVRQLVMSHHFTFDDSRQARLSRCPLRYIWPAELDLMAQLAGFELESRHADWSGSEFTAESRSHVSVYRIRPGR